MQKAQTGKSDTHSILHMCTASISAEGWQVVQEEIDLTRLTCSRQDPGGPKCLSTILQETDWLWTLFLTSALLAFYLVQSQFIIFSILKYFLLSTFNGCLKLQIPPYFSWISNYFAAVKLCSRYCSMNKGYYS